MHPPATSNLEGEVTNLCDQAVDDIRRRRCPFQQNNCVGAVCGCRRASPVYMLLGGGAVSQGGLSLERMDVHAEVQAWVAALLLLGSALWFLLTHYDFWCFYKKIVVLHDMASPRYNVVWLLGNLLGDMLGLWPLQPEPLIREAKRRSGLSDFGDESECPFREGLKVFLETANDPATHMTAMGRLRFYELVIQLLVTRLRVQDMLTKNPGILEEKVDRPIFIAGLPRSGTTHLYWILATHKRLKAPVFYEMVQPVISFNIFERLLWKAGYDPRYTKGFFGYMFSKSLRPHYQALHDSGPNRPEEDMMLTALTFQSLLFAVFVSSDKYLNWYQTKDSLMPIKYLRIMLQVMQWQEKQMGLPPRRWLLKSIDHIQHLPAIKEIFPDAIIVQTHRDPVPVLASSITLVSYGCGMNCCPVDLKMMGRLWTDHLERMFRDFVNDQKHHAKGRVCNVMFDDFVDDNIKQIQKVLKVAEIELDQEDLATMESFIASNKRFRRGKVAYSFSRFGVDGGAIRDRLKFYQEYFNVSSNGSKMTACDKKTLRNK